MALNELTPIPTPALPLAGFRDHLRLSSGFADSATEDDLLESYLRAAISVIEGRLSKALIARDFSWHLRRWRDDYAQVLPLSPVSAVSQVQLIDAQGADTTVDPSRYILQADGLRPRIVAAASALPAIPTKGSARIRFTAGFGPDWSDLPPDLAQAVLLLAAEFYETRSAGPRGEDLSFGVRALLERWRDIRPGMGGKGATR